MESTGSRCTYVASGVIDLRKVDGLANKLGHLSSEIELVLREYKPSAVTVESVFHGKMQSPHSFLARREERSWRYWVGLH